MNKGTGESSRPWYASTVPPYERSAPVDARRGNEPLREEVHDVDEHLSVSHGFYQPAHSGPLERCAGSNDDRYQRASEDEIAYMSRAMQRMDFQVKNPGPTAYEIALANSGLRKFPFPPERSPLTRFDNLIQIGDLPQPKRLASDIYLDDLPDAQETADRFRMDWEQRGMAEGKGAGWEDKSSHSWGKGSGEGWATGDRFGESNYSQDASAETLTKSMPKGKGQDAEAAAGSTGKSWRSGSSLWKVAKKGVQRELKIASDEVDRSKLLDIPSLRKPLIDKLASAFVQTKFTTGYEEDEDLPQEPAPAIMVVDMDTLFFHHIPGSNWYCRWRDLCTCSSIESAFPDVEAGVKAKVASTGVPLLSDAARRGSITVGGARRGSIAQSAYHREKIKVLKVPDQLNCDLCGMTIVKKGETKTFYKCRRCQGGDSRYCLCHACYSSILTSVKMAHFTDGHPLMDVDPFRDFTRLEEAYPEEQDHDKMQRLPCKVCRKVIQLGQSFSVCTVCRFKGERFEKCSRCKNYYKEFKLKQIVC